MKIVLTLVSLLALVGCQTAGDHGFSEAEKDISVGRNWRSFLVEVVFPFDPPTGRAYFFDLSDGEMKGFVRELGEKNERRLNSTEAHQIFAAFQTFDWGNPVDDYLYDPELIAMFPDDFSVTLKSADSFAEREIRIGFSESVKIRNLLSAIGLMIPSTEKPTEQAAVGNGG